MRCKAVDFLSVFEPLECDREVALEDLAGDGGAHALVQKVVGEEEGHDGGGS